MNQILLVEDQEFMQLLIRNIFQDGQNSVTVAGTAAEAIRNLNNQTFDVMLLDISLPDKNGLDFYGQLIENPRIGKTPVIFLTGAENLTNKLAAFSMGAEDYITKGTNPHEIKARVLAKIRKKKDGEQNKEENQIGSFLFKLSALRVFNLLDGKEIVLSSREFRLLYYLAKNEDRVLSRNQILDEVWGKLVSVTDRTVDTSIYQLRKKMGDFGLHIESVLGEGYRFTLNPEAVFSKSA